MEFDKYFDEDVIKNGESFFKEYGVQINVCSNGTIRGTTNDYRGYETEVVIKNNFFKHSCDCSKRYYNNYSCCEHVYATILQRNEDYGEDGKSLAAKIKKFLPMKVNGYRTEGNSDAFDEALTTFKEKYKKYSALEIAKALVVFVEYIGCIFYSPQYKKTFYNTFKRAVEEVGLENNTLLAFCEIIIKKFENFKYIRAGAEFLFKDKLFAANLEQAAVSELEYIGEEFVMYVVNNNIILQEKNYIKLIEKNSRPCCSLDFLKTLKRLGYKEAIKKLLIVHAKDYTYNYFENFKEMEKILNLRKLYTQEELDEVFITTAKQATFIDYYISQRKYISEKTFLENKSYLYIHADGHRYANTWAVYEKQDVKKAMLKKLSIYEIDLLIDQIKEKYKKEMVEILIEKIEKLKIKNKERYEFKENLDILAEIDYEEYKRCFLNDTFFQDKGYEDLFIKKFHENNDLEKFGYFVYED